MSLILEALRKSEAERQRGRAPGLFVEQVAARPGARARTPGWAWLLGALLLATLATLAWRAWPPQEQGQVPLPEVSGTPPEANAPPSIAAVSPAEVAAPPTAGDEAAGLPVAPARSSVAARPPPAPAAVAEPVPASLPTSPEVNLTPFLAPAPVVGEALPTLASLDAGTRAQLPPLKLSMHVYADAPAQRFVILDGQRLVEGASPASGVVLEEIRRDGLVLSVNGQRLLLARP